MWSSEKGTEGKSQCERHTSARWKPYGFMDVGVLVGGLNRHREQAAKLKGSVECIPILGGGWLSLSKQYQL